MNIFFYHDQKNHSSLIDELAWCGHNERIDVLERYKAWMKKIPDADFQDTEDLERANRICRNAIKYYDRLIKVCNKYKHQPAVTEEWFKEYLKKKGKRIKEKKL